MAHGSARIELRNNAIDARPNTSVHMPAHLPHNIHANTPAITMQALHEAQSEPLNAAAAWKQLEQLKSGARSVCGSGVKAALYHLEEFIH